MPVHIGNNISFLRRLKGIHQKEIADKLQMSQQNYSAIEKKELVSDEVLTMIAGFLEFPLEAFKESNLDQKVNNVFQHNCDHPSVFYYGADSSKKLEALYEKIIRDKEDQIEYLKQRLNKYEG